MHTYVTSFITIFGYVNLWPVGNVDSLSVHTHTHTYVPVFNGELLTSTLWTSLIWAKYLHVPSIDSRTCTHAHTYMTCHTFTLISTHIHTLALTHVSTHTYIHTQEHTHTHVYPSSHTSFLDLTPLGSFLMTSATLSSTGTAESRDDLHCISNLELLIN